MCAGVYRRTGGSWLHVHAEDLAWNELHDTNGTVFRAEEPGFFSDWHIAPRRQYIITLSGEAEIGLKDGTVHGLGSGDVNLAEELTGFGHRSGLWVVC